ncbi:carbohydrate ABC transporter permease [Dictyobacter aurantiacus]|uniref:Sugar ABC transporter permease n=1 Tax=Dictyobacter aurantiacus TaxID=1936993 RepID=A0A401ZH41_9CHLR|nr:sugar ABC transporter permease [Dictyobacter aurantiacus]GCE06113.1 sugar ABC transporter permease [Dictyobacter aurantiacus]
MTVTPAMTRSRPLSERVPRKPRRMSSAEKKENLAAHLFLLPWFLGIIIFTAGPVLGSLYLSFTNYNLIGTPAWVGLRNYLTMFHDPQWWNSVRVTLLYVFFSVPLKLIFAMAIALLLKQGLRGLGLFRAIYYVPSLLGGSVAIALLWRQIFNSDGVVNQALGFIGIHISISWISTPEYALPTLIILAIWQFGSPMLIFLAGLKQIPQEYYEAASTDGSGPWRNFFSITLPLITPLVFFNLILQMVGAFQAFTPAFVVSGGSGGPLDSTLFYTLYVYQQGFGYLQMGYASAMSWILLVAIGVFSVIAFLSSRYWVFYQDDGR